MLVQVIWLQWSANVSKAKGDTPTCSNRNELLSAVCSSEGGSALIQGNLSIVKVLRA